MLLAVAAFAAVGCKRGFARSLSGVLSYALSAILAAVLMPAASGLLAETELSTKIAELVNQKYISAELGSVASDGGIFAKYLSKAAVGAADTLSRSIAGIILNIIAFVAVLLAVRLIIFILGKLFGIVLKLPIIKQLNGLGGAVAGGLLGVLVLYTVFALAAAFVPLGNGFIASEIEKSSFAKGMYEDNIFINLIGTKNIEKYTGGINE